MECLLYTHRAISTSYAVTYLILMTPLDKDLRPREAK